MNDMDGQVSVVIGGGGGLGEAICHALAKAGSRVVVTYNTREQVARDLVAALAGDGHIAAQVAVEDSAALADPAARIAVEHGRGGVRVAGERQRKQREAQGQQGGAGVYE